MKYIIDKTKRPIYLQLYKQIRDDIIKGVYPFGGRLPSERILAEETGVSVITAEHAYQLLCDEGYAVSRRRSGYFAVFKKTDGFVRSNDEPPDRSSSPAVDRIALPADRTPPSADRNSFPIDRPSLSADFAAAASVPFGSALAAHSAETSFPSPMTPPTAASVAPPAYPAFSVSILSKTMRRVLSDYYDVILEKSPNKGCTVLKEAIKSYLARNRGINVDAAQIVIGSGAEYLYGLMVMLLGKDRIYGIESPSYDVIEKIYKTAGARYELLPLKEDGIDTEALFKSRASVLHTTPYQSFPSGVTASASKRHQYIAWSNENDRFIIESDYGSEFAVSSAPMESLFALASRDNVIYTNTFSKTISSSLRVGYMVLPVRLAAQFEEKLGFYSCTVPTFEQYVLTELLNGGDFERHINRVRRSMRKKLAEKTNREE